MTETATSTDNFTRVLHPLMGKSYRVFVKVEYRDGRLSITGVEGPLSSGNCLGGCGQIDMHLRDGQWRKPESGYRPADGWTRQDVDKLLEYWGAWHLNDMHAGCEHQRADNWGQEDVEIVTYRLTSEALKDKREVEQHAMRELKERGRVELSSDYQALLALPYETHDAPDADGPASGRYEVKKRETKKASWVRCEEHPRGVLGKPCPTCGYKYGTAWKRSEVPADVLEWLKSRPETPVTPAWV